MRKDCEERRGGAGVRTVRGKVIFLGQEWVQALHDPGRPRHIPLANWRGKSEEFCGMWETAPWPTEGLVSFY